MTLCLSNNQFGALDLFSFLQALSRSTATRSVTTLQETLAAQVPEKQKKMAQLKKEYGDHVYVQHNDSAKDAKHQ